jgi:predicted RecB family nuclease
MTVTSALFEAYLKCPTKCFLKSRGETEGRNAYANWIESENENYRTERRQRLLDRFPSGERIPSSENLRDLKGGSWRFAVDLSVQAQGLSSTIHMIERVPLKGRGKTAVIPIRLVVTNKLVRDDKFLLAFDALILSKNLGRDVAFGKIIYGDQHATLKVKTLGLMDKVRKLTSKTAALLANASPPELVLNEHCAACEFQSRCREKAIEKDDLSLLPRMTEKERTKFHSRGIFGITQLSYTFRPRRRPKRFTKNTGRYSHALKALAIRERKIHVVGNPELKIEGTPVYLDVEGLPDRNFYYLIGARFKVAREIVQYSLWADDAIEERRIWSDFLGVLSGLENPVLIHYGSYETTFLKHMSTRYGAPKKDSIPGLAMASRLNLLSVIFGSIYFPGYSNGLKDCAKSLGFHWSVPNASGALAVLWRLQWEKTADPMAKESLQKYNAEDCEALQGLTEFVSRLSRPLAELTDTNQPAVVKVEALPRHALFKFRKVQFQVPELATINDAAYWNYQRQRVLVKSARHGRNMAEKVKNPRQPKLNPNKIIRCPAPLKCFRCGGKTLYEHQKCSKTVIDVKLSATGIKRWITKYLFNFYRCPRCRAVFRTHGYTWTSKKFGDDLRAFAVYENIGLGMPQQRVAIFLKEVLCLDLGRGAVNKFKKSAAVFYNNAYENLVKKLASGRLIHADETKVNLTAGVGYVWAFTSLEDVVYVYTASRKGDLIHSLLKDFKGVLVSDFYAAYDSINCPQQKCLIHLIRDLNEDLMKEPFNDEMKALVSEFAMLLKAIISTVDRFGLKARYLGRHKRSVDGFFKRLAQQEYQTETAQKCKTRLEKNRFGLFTFLDFDGVPWNNNNAEHAIKAVAMLRRDFNGRATEKGIHEYLILLSICESCKFRGVSFLEFVRSGKTDLDAFVACKQRGTRNRRLVEGVGHRGRASFETAV